MVTLLVLGTLVFVGCGKKAAKAPTADPAAGGAAATAAPAAGGAAATAAPGAGPISNKLEVRPKGEELAFNPNEFVVAAGTEITVNFENTSVVNPHNWILLNSNSEELATKLDTDGAAAGLDKGYMPADLTNVLAHTKLLQPGEKDTITFNAPTTPGTYIFICTVPGHFVAGCRGTVVVK